jgi:hypothetical protein
VAELPLEGEMVRFTLPTTIAPRYQGQGTTASEREALKEVTTMSSTSSSSSSSKPYGLELDIAIEMPSPVLRYVCDPHFRPPSLLFTQFRVRWCRCSVESPSHPIRFQLNGDAPTKGRVTLATQETALDRDFVLMIQQKDAHQPGLWVDSERQAVMLSLYPKFIEVEQKREFIFLRTSSASSFSHRAAYFLSFPFVSSFSWRSGSLWQHGGLEHERRQERAAALPAQSARGLQIQQYGDT